MRQARGGEPILDFRVGVADSVAKSLAYHLLEPALQVEEPVRLICSEGKFPDLLSQLALHRLDLVLADEPMSRRVSVRAFNHLLGSTHLSFFCAPRLRRTLQGPFPQCLNDAPMLIPGLSASVRGQLEGWFTLHQVQPRIVGEFEDGALMTAFGREARGVFTGPSVLEEEIVAQQGVEVLGRSNELEEQLFAISVERNITHPCLRAITDAARDQVFSPRVPLAGGSTVPD